MKGSIEVSVKYDLGHIYKENWAYEDMYCTHCGKKGYVYSEQSEGDYYQGCMYICISCGATANEPRMYPSENNLDEQRITQIKNSIDNSKMEQL